MSMTQNTTQNTLETILGKLYYVYNKIGYSSVIPSSHTLLGIKTNSINSFEESFYWGECKTQDTELLNYFETPIKRKWTNNIDWTEWTKDELVFINKWKDEFNKRWIEPSKKPKCSYCTCNIKQELEYYNDSY